MVVLWAAYGLPSTANPLFHRTISHLQLMSEIVSNELEITGDSDWPSSKKPIGNHIKDIIKLVKPIFQDLPQDVLLSKFLYVKTQNQNESFNGMIWNRIPKDTFVKLDQFEIGLYDAVDHFNIDNHATTTMLLYVF